MSHWARKFNVTHSLSTNFCQRNFNTTFLADNTAVLESLVLSAEALVVLDRAKNLGAEKTIALRLERTVVNSLGLLDLAVRPRSDHFG